MEERKYLGIDWGEARIGLSLGDNVLYIATPHVVVANLKEVLEEIEKEDIDEIVLGYPRRLGEGEERLHQGYLIFKKQLEEATEIKLNSFDERLSSKAADALVGNKKTKAPRDAVAAMIILQSYLDSIS
ncbi:MAG: Holliday junction resolvase RuvX [Patescibacteria group bacterium]|jgi:putative Holliday junction resolvase|nr:Holliday junction resolvase RuvX [Patescibacteria group bacterium]